MKRRILPALIALLLIATAVSACSKQPEDTDSPTDTTNTSAVSTTDDDKSEDEKEPQTAYVEYYKGDELLKTDTAKIGFEYTVSFTPDAIDGYTFSGWKYEDGNPCEEKITLTASVKLYADFTANTYKVFYGADGGEMTKQTDTVTFGQSFTLEVPKKEGFSFQGWLDGATPITDKDGKSLEAWSFLSDKDLSANWVFERTLTLSSADTAAGSVSGEGTYLEGQSVTVLATPNLGYRFVGWYDGDDLVSEDAEYTFTITFCDRSYDARWEMLEEMTPFVFTSTADTCVITGLKDPDVTEVHLPGIVTEISDGAFEGSAVTVFSEYKGGKYRGNAERIYCTLYEITDKNISSFEMHPDSYEIREAVFLNCTKLERVSLSPKLVSIGVAAFNNCASLVEIDIPSGVLVIDEHTFNGCSSLERVSLPDSLTTIGSFAFSGCSSLDSITLPASLTRISIWAFQRCEALQSVYFEVTDGWKAANDNVSPDDLSNPATAATYLTDTYYTSLWRREAQATN